MHLVLFDKNPELCNCFRESFSKYPDIEIIDSSKIDNLPSVDCIVSPANSFGLMDGGFDKVLTDYFGEQLMNRVQDYIIGRYAGEQPVGTSFIIETHNDKIPYLAHTPTMKVPSSIKESDNVYQAMKAMLLAVGQYEKASYKTELDNDSISIVNDTLVKHTLDSVACCGLGTSTGGVSCRSAAYQMAAAYKDFLNPPRQLSWRYALSKIEVRMTTIHENSD